MDSIPAGFFIRMKMSTTYDRCLNTMYDLRRFGIKLGLSTIKTILHGLGDPQNTYACIHVAGTNGKGSVASSLASILSRSGYKTGLYTSPHLISFNERIQINNRPITNQAVINAYRAVKRVHQGKREPTFFEFATAMALHEFGRQHVDWGIIGTGMGGRLDATNVIRPRLCIITNISLEHRDYLGNTLTQIAREKAGIIKPRTPVITGIRQKAALSVVNQIAAKKSAPLYRFGKDFKVRRQRSSGFSYFGIDNTWHDLKTGLQGNHQVDNAAIVLAACELLNKRKAKIHLSNIQSGMLQNQWPGRLEIVSTEPTIILDGAHNFMAARHLTKFLSTHYAGRNITLVAGILGDKPYKSILKSLLSVCNRAVLTQAKTNRALNPQLLARVAKRIVSDVTIISDVLSAVQHAIKNARPEDVICIAGSLYVVGEAKEALESGLLGPDKKSN